ncbi:hypothetical protein AK812_SmicGene11710 [Symbiodinium microadriaticum]|uniref:25S rRNA (uridine-N(3))-methyltransferase BMT5-like domain-containing protein n=1 Tax=Symbiodinium microadriaticum TaxID=2951 RepID=A0A1Q9ECK2_SYMMI|nr:hypothetical protein AK812_SmicGene11710 [Symbiodinium microadriaticum]
MDLDTLVSGLFDTLGRLLFREVVEEDDIVIATEPISTGFVCHVVLPCLGGISFEGQSAKLEQDAMTNAVRLCLESFCTAAEAAGSAMQAARKQVVTIEDEPQEEPLPTGRQGWAAPKVKPKVKAMPKIAKAKAWPTAPAASPPSKAFYGKGEAEQARPMPPTVPPPGTARPAPPPTPPPETSAPAGSEPKVLLHTLLTKITGQSPMKADVEYCNSLVGGDHQCILILNCLEGRAFAGYPLSTRKDAELSAASVAIDWLQENLPNQPPTSRKRPQPPTMALPVDAEVQPPAKRAKKENEVDRTLSSGSIQSQEGAEIISEWRDARLEPCELSDIQDPASLEYYFGQACLICGAIVSIKGWDAHASGKKHLQRLQAQPMKLRAGIERPLPAPSCELLDSSRFVETGGWSQPDEFGEYPTVLTLGEMDYSFSLAVAQLRPAGSVLVATSYLAEHDPNEVEVHPSDDGQRVLHSVDATNLAGTLQSQGVEGSFHTVVFPFPRYSLSRAPNPNNSRLLRDFFISVIRDGILLDGGYIQISRVALPMDFYQDGGYIQLVHSSASS